MPSERVGDWVLFGPNRNVRVAPCITCVYKSTTGPTCPAFPDGIPVEILRGDNDHSKPYPGDHGIRYESVWQW